MGCRQLSGARQIILSSHRNADFDIEGGAEELAFQLGFQCAEQLGTEFAATVILIEKRQQIPARIRRLADEILHTA